MSRRRAAKLYEIPESTLRDRMKGVPEAALARHPKQKLIATEEETLVRYILDLDSRGFPPRISDV